LWGLRLNRPLGEEKGKVREERKYALGKIPKETARKKRKRDGCSKSKSGPVQILKWAKGSVEKP